LHDKKAITHNMNPQELQRAEELKAKYKIGGYSGQPTTDPYTVTVDDVLRFESTSNLKPVAPKKTILEKVGSGLDMVFGGGKTGEAIGTKIAESSPEGQRLKQMEEQGLVPAGTYAQTFEQPTGKEVLGSALQSASLFIPGGAGASLGSKVLAGVGTGYAFDVAQNLQENTEGAEIFTPGLGSAIGGAVPVVGTGIVKGAKAIKPVAQATRDIVSPVMSPITQIPKNIKTNVQTGIATDKAIRQLPTKPLQNAVRSGVDIQDVQTLSKLDKATKESSKKLVKTVKDFADGKTNRNPIELVGQPIVKRLQTLTNQTKQIGAKLDKTAKGLQFKSVQGIDDLFTKADDSLRNLDVNLGKQKGGKLDFVGSQLEDIGENAKIVDRVYKRLINSKDAYELHRLKKYIDDNVTFGKTSQGMTGTAENLLKTWRKSIDDVLDKQFKTYKQLNDEYAKRISPINSMKQFLKSNTGLDEDLLSLKAGGLMRRLTSNAQSKAELKQILRNLDKATKTKGKIATSTEQLVELFSILEKYYPEIIGKNTFRGQITGAIEDVKGFSEMAIGAAKKLGGQTDAVKRKAFEEALKDIFGKELGLQGGFVRIGKETPKTVLPKSKVNESVSSLNDTTPQIKLKVTQSTGDSKYYDITDGKKKIGEIETIKDYFGDGDVHIQFIGVDESARGKGIATKTLQKIIEDNPKAKTFSAEPTNKAAFDLNVKVFGKPTEISDDISDLTLKEARERLPDIAQYTDGELDSTNRVFVRFNKPKINK
jgi:hypothetical protein